jgi:hypothetical protein
MGSSSTRRGLLVRPERIRLDGGRRIMEAQDYPGTSSRWELKVSSEGGCIRITARGNGPKTWKIRLQLPENISLRLLQALCLLLGSSCGARDVQGPREADSGRGCAHFMDHCDVEARDSSIALVAFTDLSVHRSCRLDGPLCVANGSTVTRREADSAELYELDSIIAHMRQEISMTEPAVS